MTATVIRRYDWWRCFLHCSGESLKYYKIYHIRLFNCDWQLDLTFNDIEKLPTFLSHKITHNIQTINSKIWLRHAKCFNNWQKICVTVPQIENALPISYRKPKAEVKYAKLAHYRLYMINRTVFVQPYHLKYKSRWIMFVSICICNQAKHGTC